MSITRLRLPTPALILSCLALFAALGGSTYAATHTSARGKLHFTNTTLENSWTNYGPPFGPVGYAKDSLGVVHLRGALHSGSSGTVAFVLPRALRPRHVLDLPVYTFNVTPGALSISPNGEVKVAGGAASTLTSLDGVSFAAGE